MSAEAPGAADADEFDKEAWLAEKEPYMRKRFEELFKQQDAVDGLLAELAKERHELEEKYIKLCAPYLETRNKIVRGDEVPAGGEGDVKGIPDFWTKVFMSHEAFDELLSEKDADVLQHLQDVQVERSTTTGEDGKPRWTVKLVFSFDKNDYFEETQLTKTYVYMDQEESVASEAVGCDITWKSGKDPTKKVLEEERRQGRLEAQNSGEQVGVPVLLATACARWPLAAVDDAGGGAGGGNRAGLCARVRYCGRHCAVSTQVLHRTGRHGGGR